MDSKTMTERKLEQPVSGVELMGYSKWELMQIVLWAISPLSPDEQRTAIDAVLQKARRRLADKGLPGPSRQPTTK